MAACGEGLSGGALRRCGISPKSHPRVSHLLLLHALLRLFCRLIFVIRQQPATAQAVREVSPAEQSRVAGWASFRTKYVDGSSDRHSPTWHPACSRMRAAAAAAAGCCRHRHLPFANSCVCWPLPRFIAGRTALHIAWGD